MVSQKQAGGKGWWAQGTLQAPVGDGVVSETDTDETDRNSGRILAMFQTRAQGVWCGYSSDGKLLAAPV